MILVAHIIVAVLYVGVAVAAWALAYVSYRDYKAGKR
jgi:hypothetical protein